MNIYINGNLTEVADNTVLAEIVEAQGLPDFGIAAAIDGKVVPRKEWKSRKLSEGSRLTIIKAVCGG